MVFFGAVLIVASGCLFGVIRVLKEREKLSGYTLLVQIIFDIIELIKYKKLKTGEIIKKLSNDSRYNIFCTLQIFADEIRSSGDISFACEKSFTDDRTAPYERELYKILKVIGRDSEEMQIEKLIYLKSEIEREVAAKKEEFIKNKKLYTTLSFGVSFILVLMLI